MTYAIKRFDVISSERKREREIFKLQRLDSPDRKDFSTFSLEMT